VTVAVGAVVGILTLQGAVRPHQHVLEGLGVTHRPVRTPADLDSVDALVLPGGESTTLWMLLESKGLTASLKKRLDDGMPALGTCAGMIMLADTVLDGRPDQGSLAAIDVSVRRNAFGRQVASFEARIDVSGLAGPPFHAVFIRAPFVERVGDGVEVLANVDGHPVAVRQGAVLATAFHPELAGDDRMHRLFVESLAG
jgi:pyridoxal 5'-phosphate synthase pdxT subunit